ncbi:MAG: hypothetical protein KJP05_01660 [Deltaproteobacteria bacterium]|nr:hypothetical protein [Deltaproteobacteria bacterium]
MNCCRETTKMGGQPQGVGSEAYLNGTSQGPTPEDARKDDHIIRARYATLSPAPQAASTTSGFPVSWSQQVIHEISGLDSEDRNARKNDKGSRGYLSIQKNFGSHRGRNFS